MIYALHKYIAYYILDLMMRKIINYYIKILTFFSKKLCVLMYANHIYFYIYLCESVVKLFI